MRPWPLTIRIAPQRPKMDVQLNSSLAQHSLNPRRSWLITFDGKQLDLIIHIIINMTCAALRPHQLHEQPFRLAKDHVQPLAALDSPLPNDKKILIWHHLSSLRDIQASWRWGGGLRGPEEYCYGKYEWIENSSNWKLLKTMFFFKLSIWASPNFE